MQVSTVYSVPLTVCDTEAPDTLRQAITALEILDKTVDGVFGRISQRVNHEKERMKAVSERITAAGTKVSQIRGSTRATTTFASAKYPVLPTSMMYWQSMYDGMELIDVPQVPDDDMLEPVMIADASCHKGKGGRGLLNLFSATAPVHREFSTKVEKKEGLGKLPSYLPSIGSVLLFNSSENPL